MPRRVSLLDLQRHFTVIVGQEDHIGVGFFDLCQLSGEVLITGGIRLKSHHRAAVLFKGLLEEFSNPLVIIRGHIIQTPLPSSPFRLSRANLATTRPWKGSIKAARKTNFLRLIGFCIQGGLGIGRPWADQNRLTALGNLRGRDRIPAGIRANNRDDVILGDQLLSRGSRLVSFTGIILDEPTRPGISFRRPPDRQHH